MVSEKHKKAVLAVLKVMPATQQEIRERAKIGKDTSRLALQALRAAGECHIGAWRWLGRKPSRVYHAGPGIDVKPPKRVVEPVVRRTGAWRDPLVAALFGQP